MQIDESKLKALLADKVIGEACPVDANGKARPCIAGENCTECWLEDLKEKNSALRGEE